MRRRRRGRVLLSTVALLASVLLVGLTTGPAGALVPSSRATAVTATGSVAAAGTVSDGGTRYLPLAPTRVVSQLALAGGRSVVVDLSARGLALPRGVTAVSVNVTASGIKGSARLSLCPAGRTAETCGEDVVVGGGAPGTDVSNFTTVRLGPDRTASDGSSHPGAGTDDAFDVYSTSESGLLLTVDVVGMHTTQTGVGSTLRATSPQRLPETAPLQEAQFRTVSLPGVPAGASAVVLRTTASAVTRTTYLSTCPVDRADAACKATSSLNARPGQDVSNMAVVALPSGGSTVKVYNNRGTVRLNLDITGYYVSGDGGSVLYPVGGPVGGTGPTVAGAYTPVSHLSVPEDATAVLLYVGAYLADVDGSTYVSVCPSGVARDACRRTSVLNITGIMGATASVVLPVDGTRSFSVYLDRGQAHLVLRVAGVYRAVGTPTGDRLLSSTADGECVEASEGAVSGDGTHAAWVTVPTWRDPGPRLRVVDRATGRQQLVGARAGGGSVTAPLPAVLPSLDRSGSRVAFVSTDVRQVGGQVYVEDLRTGALTLVSRTSAGAPGNGLSTSPVISDDGSTVLFFSDATDIVTPAAVFATSTRGIFVADLATGEVRRVPGAYVLPSGAPNLVGLSADGRYVAHASVERLSSADTDGSGDFYLHDRRTGTSRLVTPALVEGALAGADIVLSGDGNQIALRARVPVPGGPSPAVPQVVHKNLVTGEETVVSTDTSGRPGSTESRLVSLDAAGTTVVFSPDGPLNPTVQFTSTLFARTVGSGEVRPLLATTVSVGARARDFVAVGDDPGDALWRAYSPMSVLSCRGVVDRPLG